jgi:hypothetical protein
MYENTKSESQILEELRRYRKRRRNTSCIFGAALIFFDLKADSLSEL